MRLLDVEQFWLSKEQQLVLTSRAELERDHINRWSGKPKHVKYAVLSHRWQRDEVLYEHVRHGTAAVHAGYPKLVGALRQAQAAYCTHLWVDTCCIDKSSSAELSEAINSMYNWYLGADVCLAYLYDIEDKADLTTSEWFNRGWTLQELLAPQKVIFYDKYWARIGDKIQDAASISARTNIPVSVLKRERRVQDCSIAARMSWASRRVTSRLEDEAYCLMGLFDVNMAMLYGEGHKSFQRLQEEIIKTLDDYSLFAWRIEDAPEDRRHGLLADRVSAFEKSNDIMSYHTWQDTGEVSISNRGLKIELGCDGKFAILPCAFESQPTGFLAIRVESVATSTTRYFRSRLDELKRVFVEGSPRLMCFPLHSEVSAHRLNVSQPARLRFPYLESSDGAQWIPCWVYTRDKSAHQPIQSLSVPPSKGADDAEKRFCDERWANRKRMARSGVEVTFAKWAAGIELAIKFQRTFDGLYSEPSANFLLLLGTVSRDDMGELGFDVKTVGFKFLNTLIGWSVTNLALGQYSWVPSEKEFTFFPRAIGGEPKRMEVAVHPKASLTSVTVAVSLAKDREYTYDISIEELRAPDSTKVLKAPLWVRRAMKKD